MTAKQPQILLIFEFNNEVENTKIIDKLSDKHEVYSTTLQSDNFHNIIALNNIHVYITIGDNWREFNHLFSRYGNKLLKKWTHKTYEESISSDLSNIAINIFFKASVTDIKNEMISYYITAYNSGNIIYRPYNSLLEQTYKNWELVIIDDSEDSNKETENIARNITSKDLRVKYFRSRHSGFIGEVKNYAARLCKGYVICELDHDDEIVPDLTDKLNDAYKNDEDIIFVSSNCCELYDDTQENVIYGEYYAYGYGSYINEWHRNKWRSISIYGGLNVTTVRDIIGVPNHIRTWRASSLFEIGYNNSDMYVSDDYELMLRTLIYCYDNNKKISHLPIFGYYQYRNRNIGNHTFKRNREIRSLQSLSHKYHSDKINEIIPLLQERYYPGKEKQHAFDNYDGRKCNTKWMMPYSWIPQNFNKIEYDKDQYKVSIVISTFKRPELLLRAIESCLSQTYQNFEIIIVGDKCPNLDEFMNSYNGPKDKIRWWNLLTNSKDGGATPKNYALRNCVRTNLVCYLDDDNAYTPTHLENLVNKFKEDSNLGFVFSSMEMGGYKIICREPKKMRVDTSTFMHKRELLDKYGYWRKISEAGYSHDFEIVSRWVNGCEKWAPTEQVTMLYNMETQSLNNPRGIYLAYGDQIPLEDENNVVFITLFNQDKYVDMLFIMLEAINKYENLKSNTDILIYTSTNFMNRIKDSEYMSNRVLFEINDNYNNIDLACKARLDLFGLPIYKIDGKFPIDIDFPNNPRCEDFVFEIKCNDHLKEEFTKIYDTNFCIKGSRSGSYIENTLEYNSQVIKLIKENNIKSVIDIGCGDWQSSYLIYEQLENIDYLGIDCVDSVINRNIETHLKYNFKCLNILENLDELGDSDLFIIKDVLQHWRLEDIYKLLDFLTTQRRFKYILITNNGNQNIDNLELDHYIGIGRGLHSDYLPLKKYDCKLLHNYFADENKHMCLISKVNQINIFSLCYNESILIPHMVEHYRKYLPSCKITIYDNESTDNSVEIARSLDCEVISFSTDGITNNLKQLEIKNNCWKEVKDGWIIIIDMDEFLCVTEEDFQKENGTTILSIKGAQMIGESLLPDLSDINLQEIVKYVPNRFEDKHLCFYRNNITEINYLIGAHKCRPVGSRIKYSLKNYINKHICSPGLPFLINRQKERYERTKINREKYGHSFHYSNDVDKISDKYNEELRKSEILCEDIKKNVIVICIFNNEKFIDMLYLLLESINRYGNLDSKTDILIYTSTPFMNKIKESSYKVIFEVNDNYNNIDKACKARLDMFSFKYISMYEKILYLDSDIIVNCDINTVLNLKLENKIYALEEGAINSTWNYWGCSLFNYKFVEYEDKSAFTSGMMLFNNCVEIKNLFQIVKKDIIDRPEKLPGHDQCYIVYNAFKYRLYNNKLMKSYFINNSFDVDGGKIIHHFPGQPGNHLRKFSLMARFLSLKNDNQGVVDNILKTKKFIDDNLLPIIKNIDKPLEGNIFMLHHTTVYTNVFINKAKNISKIVLEESIENVCEIGFNAGFSSLLMLLSNPKIKITCFDLGAHSYTIPCYLKIKEIFGDRINLIIGDSNITLLDIDEKFDLIHIDGGHETIVAENDIKNCYRLSKNGTILIMDDYDFPNLNELWNSYIVKYDLKIPSIFLYECPYHDVRMI